MDTSVCNSGTWPSASTIFIHHFLYLIFCNTIYNASTLSQKMNVTPQPSLESNLNISSSSSSLVGVELEEVPDDELADPSSPESELESE